MQRVLQSDFLNAVREVYESVYETVDISGKPELRANATAKVIEQGVTCGPKVMLYEVFHVRFLNLCEFMLRVKSLNLELK